MHTASSLKNSMFKIEMNGQLTDREGLLDWRTGDRLGIVLNSPLSALGASMLIQLVTTAYFDVRPSRREAPHYAEIYLFHSGGRYGDFTSFDVLPRRELFLSAEPGTLIEAINDRAITHLAIPDGMPRKLTFPWTETESVHDRIRHCFAYAAQGRTSDADIAITSRDPDLRNDVELTLQPKMLLENIERYIDAGGADVQLYSKKLAQRLRSRLTEIGEDDQATAKKYHAAVTNDGVMSQTFRKISIDEALSLL
jgi:hypothetical protein